MIRRGPNRRESHPDPIRRDPSHRSRLDHLRPSLLGRRPSPLDRPRWSRLDSDRHHCRQILLPRDKLSLDDFVRNDSKTEARLAGRLGERGHSAMKLE
jgi:hypothetical protein